MRVPIIILALGLSSLLVFGCIEECANGPCPTSADIHFETADGTPVATFEGSAVVFGDETVFACQDGQNVDPDGGYACLDTGGVSLGMQPVRDIEMHVTSGRGSFSGEVDFGEPKERNDGCGKVCENMAATVVLE